MYHLARVLNARPLCLLVFAGLLYGIVLYRTMLFGDVVRYCG